MALLDRIGDLMGRSSDETDVGRTASRTQAAEDAYTQSRERNVGENERAVSVAAGAILALQGLSRRTIPGWLTALVGGAMIYRGVTGYCHLYAAAGMDTAGGGPMGQMAKSGVRVATAFTINRSAADLYAFWRNFENLPRIMTHLESVKVIDETKSHWVAKAPKIVGGSVEWDAEIIADRPNELIAWRSVGDSQVDNAGQIMFAEAPGDRGTEVIVQMHYLPPAGKLGHFIAKMFGEAPTGTIRDDLRNFKRMMETGEVVTTDGQSMGTCTGAGTRK